MAKKVAIAVRESTRNFIRFLLALAKPNTSASGIKMRYYYQTSLKNGAFMAATKNVSMICPIGLTSELACDKWMPIILRDIGLFEHRTFNKLLKHNLEGISSGSLATKLKRLEHTGLINFVLTSEHRQKNSTI